MRFNGSNDEALSSTNISSIKVGDSGSQTPTKFMRGTHTVTEVEGTYPEALRKVASQRSHSQIEPPLKRPHTPDAISKTVERPLKRPTKSEEEIPYSDTIATFAVDVSGSTEGRVLEEEKAAIQTLCEGLSRDAFTQANIVPWNENVQPLIRADELETLTSKGGTEPSSLNTNSQAKTALSRCSAWFLLTDGEIGQYETRYFSEGICSTGLHGTPCVVILFGYKTARPVGCNISVGLSVFSNAADCLFLFHDIDTTQVYILQSKGVFNAVLPSGSPEISLDTKTLWSDVPLFSYCQLFDLPLPARQQLRSDELLLQSRRKINLKDLYENQIDSSTVGEILDNNDNLQSVLLAAQVRGDDDDLRNWISKQGLSGQNILLCERPDADHQAETTMRALLPLLAQPNLESEIFALRHDLRTAHHMNWFKFASILRAEHYERSERRTVVSEVIERISSNRGEIAKGTTSPSMLSPMPSASGGKKYVIRNNGSQDPNFPTPSLVSAPSAPRLMNRLIPGHGSAATATQLGRTDLAFDNFSLRLLQSTIPKESAGALYIQQYRRRPGESVVEGTCPICEEGDAPLVFLLKSPPTDISTPNFPLPNDRKVLAYPLAMGTYPETDILSSQISCDSCAHTMVQGKMKYNDDEVIAAIPIMESAFSGEYQSTTSRLIDTALEKRFQKSSVELVFLSIIQSTLANLDGNNIESRSEVLRKASCWIAKTTELPPSLSTSITGNTPQSGSYLFPEPMTVVLEDNINKVDQPESPLLQYPVGGFVVLMLIMADLKQVKPIEAYELAIWHRFLFHLVERHCALVATDQPKAILAVRNLLAISSADPDIGNGDERHSELIVEVPSECREETIFQDKLIDVSTGGPTPVESKLPSIRLSTICQTYLLSEEDLEDFQRLGTLFDHVEDFCSAFLHSFLNCLSQQVHTPSLAIDVFDKMRARVDLHDVFWISQWV